MVLLLRFRDQLSSEAISKLTGDRPGSLRVRVARALRALRSGLEKRGSCPESRSALDTQSRDGRRTARWRDG